MRPAILIVLFLFLGAQGKAQHQDSLHTPAQAHNIKLATTLSLIPGAGQIYNGKYWKAPLFWGGIGGTIYYYGQLNGQFNAYESVLQFIIDNPSLTTRSELEAAAPEIFTSVPSPFYQNTANGVAQESIGYMEQLRTQREYALFGVLGIYLLGILDANIDAHLHDFDVSDDLSIRPQLTTKQYFANQESFITAPGLRLTYTLP